jgi:DNA-binding NarL/FixJ family response regulator
MSTTVCLIEDNAHLRESLSLLINGWNDFRCVGAFSSAEVALRRIPVLSPHVVLMDLRLPGMDGTECTRRLKAQCPSLQILVVTVEEDPEQVFAVLEAGASGYVVKGASPARVMEALEELRRGGAPMSSQIARLVIQTFHQRGQRKRATAELLSARERQILDLLATGSRTRDIAARLCLSAETVHTHLRHIYEKLHVRTRTEAVARHLEP